ncbi:uncharacterized protein J3D65DRAFT_152920 [Phyllosticta citribraziliensis]|uniref:Uncharacterized protein n=1 Tax=Phyllosticta citribraziliensis TaxID=989973 RepID=A0ABR1L6I6_9PEZI
MPYYISNTLPGFDPSEWDILPPSSLVRQNELPPGVEALAFSVAAQVPGGRYYTTQLLEQSPNSCREAEENLHHLTSREDLELVICSTNASGAWSFKRFKNELGPCPVLVMRNGGWRAMIKKIMRVDVYLDPLPGWGIEADPGQRRIFRERTANMTIPAIPAHGRPRSQSLLVQQVAQDYAEQRVDPQTYQISDYDINKLVRYWKRDVDAGKYRPLQSWVFHWHGFLSTLTPSQRSRPFDVTIEGLDRLQLWGKWDAEFFDRSGGYPMIAAMNFPGSIHFVEQ